MGEINENPVGDTNVLTYENKGKIDQEMDYFGDEKKSMSDIEVVKESSLLDGAELYDAKGDDDDPAYSVLPQIVRELCDFEDDVNMPVLTWRFYFLSAIFTALGAWLQQMGFFRTTYVPYSIYFVQIASLYFGRLLAAVLPQKKIGFGNRFWFELNPGEFNIKEHVAIVLAASTGGTNNLGDYVLAPLQVFYNQPMNGWLAILFMLSAVFIGFSFASFARTFLVENPHTMFPLTLQQAAVFKAMRSSLRSESTEAKKQMSFFWWCILGFFCWQFLPEYAFPFTSSLAFLCWFSKNPSVQFLGSGLGGSGLLNITLDWSNIGSKCIYYPYWAQINIFVAAVIGAWILVPIGFFTGAWDSDKYPIQTQTLYLRNGSKYPTDSLMTADYQLNLTLFEEIGPPMMSAQLRWAYFFAYVAYIGSFVSCALFQGPMIYKTYVEQRKQERAYNDKLTQLIRKYPSVPLWWNVALFIIPLIILTVLTAKGVLYMPIYMLFIGIAIGACIVVPMGYIYAVSGYQMQVGYFNELFYGYAIEAGGSRHPIGSLSYRVISGQCWYEAQSMLADMKLGHYFHIPPRAVLFAQVWGIFVGVPVNYATILWVCNTKGDVLTGRATDPNHQWTGQTVISLYNQSISFALVGPRRLFDDPVYAPMLYGFLVGAIVPFILFGLHRLRPRWRFDLWNIAIFADKFENFYGNISNDFFTLFILGSINHLYFKRYRYDFWKKYAYLFGAGADTGYNFNLLIIFIAFSAVKTITMPNWWGNNADSVERCFYVPSQ
ncbi:OPT superfamily oligopeptide transporter [Dendrothele bispora CBS 962.96]|uniref:OPT superfamily oligopeptide transporter n=1 Tax=Dendrothele bispora (strain CBS 962.96) TaxID=1314807 RepID=A0A4S8LDR0_DENBC|nr:OPT superfamily oligopeptide transporter [Dendrothele bispora CBS 962.96]